MVNHFTESRTLQAVVIGSIEIRNISTLDIKFTYYTGYSERNIWGGRSMHMN